MHLETSPATVTYCPHQRHGHTMQRLHADAGTLYFAPEHDNQDQSDARHQRHKARDCQARSELWHGKRRSGTQAAREL